ncbi:hypothetical protein M430DRAFT_35720 [Amorphotheca resinae ATCC 22711]|uniref:MARVEL domain-containing protein n=1 Tax=Amorphotheca resinae ATCC 22711 TaxID=857342 RepID=A0A2T3AXQ8_AMORE|nr:hypothetical protein M430DRAFT_35720 [Amorphotheca resinae ATCC 22711]PSS14857.1 hypothetical protein M430DRAFT_35720 [Amorphotheca resinae ATCC 22711]
MAHIALTVFRFIQMIFALTVCGLYGVDLHAAHKEHKYSDAKWVYAEVVASLSAVTALLYMIPIVARVPFLFVWDALLFILWIALFGLFGKMYIHADAQGDGGIIRMKHAVWIDLVNALFWLVSAGGMAIYGSRLRARKNVGKSTV